MIELRQQVERSPRRLPFDIDRAYRDGKLVAIVGRNVGSSANVLRRYAESEAAQLLDEINEAREAQGLFGPCLHIIQPVAQKKLAALKKEYQEGDND